MPSTSSPLKQDRRGRGRPPRSTGGARDKRTEATLNAPERELHEAWLKSQGWPAIPESDIVRAVLAEHWAKIPVSVAA